MSSSSPPSQPPGADEPLLTEPAGTEEPLLVQPVVADQPAVPTTSVTAEAVIWPVRVASEWSARLLIIAAAVYVLLRLVREVSLVAFAFTLALFFTAMLHPVEARLRRHVGHRKSLSTLAVMLTGVVVLGLIGWFVADQISSHASALNTQFSQAGDRLQNWLRTGPLHLKNVSSKSWSTQLSDLLHQHQSELLSSALTTAQRGVEVLGGPLLSIITAFFLLRDGDLIWHWALGLLPRGAREPVDRASGRAWLTFGGYVRGQLTIAVIHAVTVFIALLILRVPLAAALAVIIFLGSFVPLLGLTVAGTLCVAVTYLEHGTTAAIALTVVIIVLIQAEGHVLQPVIMSRAVHIHPLAVAVGVAAGTTLYGLVGALIAVPLVAFLNSFVRGLRDEPVDPVAEAPEAATDS